MQFLFKSIKKTCIYFLFLQLALPVLFIHMDDLISIRRSRGLELPVKQSGEGQVLRSAVFGNAFLSPPSGFAGPSILGRLPRALDCAHATASWHPWLLRGQLLASPGAPCGESLGSQCSNDVPVCGCLRVSCWESTKRSGCIGWRFPADSGCVRHGAFRGTSCSPLSRRAHGCAQRCPLLTGGLFISHHRCSPQGLTRHLCVGWCVGERVGRLVF